jgi:hypothetical protein
MANKIFVYLLNYNFNGMIKFILETIFHITFKMAKIKAIAT